MNPCGLSILVESLSIIQDQSSIRLGKVTSVLAVGIWVGFELTLGLKKKSRK